MYRLDTNKKRRIKKKTDSDSTLISGSPQCLVRMSCVRYDRRELKIMADHNHDRVFGMLRHDTRRNRTRDVRARCLLRRSGWPNNNYVRDDDDDDEKRGGYGCGVSTGEASCFRWPYRR